ncbi:MAG: hypothetical protein V1803_02980 [Candidatus Roizmanbacteria bacterium]
MDINKTPFQFIRGFIEKNEELADETKKDYLNCLDLLIQNKTPDAEIVNELNGYLDKEIELLEETAIEDHSTELIDSLADLRNARTELEKNIFMLYDSDDKNENQNNQDKKAIDQILNRLSTAS